jgi:hypothetical protein
MTLPTLLVLGMLSTIMIAITWYFATSPLNREG